MNTVCSHGLSRRIHRRLSNRKRGTPYIGVTSNLRQRAWRHREGMTEGFTKKYGLKRLVWFEQQGSTITAIRREQSLKKYQRDWKTNLIERNNPHWNDLYMTLVSRGCVHGWPGPLPGHDEIGVRTSSIGPRLPVRVSGMHPQGLSHVKCPRVRTIRTSDIRTANSRARSGGEGAKILARA
jgi:putative endonuclease